MKMRKKFTALFCAMAVCIGFCSCGSDENATQQKNENTTEITTEKTAMEYQDEMGIGINLGNTFEAYWEDKNNQTTGAQRIGEDTPQNYETCWGASVTTQEAIDGIRDAGFSTVRIPIYWGNMMANDNTFTISETYFSRVDEVIGYCSQDDLYVVINMHHYDQFLIENFSQEEVLEKTEHLWKQVAERYKNYSDKLIFEGFNESVGKYREEDKLNDDAIYDYVNQLNQTFVDTVRATGGNNANRLLIVSGYWTNIDKTTDARFQMPSDSAENKLMVSVHYIDNEKFWVKKAGSEEWLNYSIGQCEELKERFVDQGIPVFVGECTAIYDGYISNKTMYSASYEILNRILELCLEYDLTPVIWDTDQNMYDRQECAIKDENNAKVIQKISAKYEMKKQ